MQALWMLAAAFFFATLAVCVKVASQWFTAAELVFWRGLIGVAVIFLWARSARVSLRTEHPGMHLWRSLFGVASLGAWFYAIARLPLATAMTLNYMSSVWVAAFLIGASLATGRPGGLVRQAPLALTVLAGFAGVLLLLRPSMAQDQIVAGLVGLGSGLLAACVFMQVRALGQIGEPELRTVFFFTVSSMVAGAAGVAVTGFSPWDWAHAGWLLPIGATAAVGQLCMTRAYSKGATLVVANLQYSGIVFAALYGVVLFGERIPLPGWAGMALIIASGIAATVLRAGAAAPLPPKDD